MQISLQFLQNEIRQINQLRHEGQKLYLVGGVVRDQYVGRQNRDIDLICDADTRGLARKFADLNGGDFFVMDVQRNTSRVIISMETGKRIFDFARQRGDTLGEDLLARDFTINAMAIDLDDLDEIIDPLDGREDLRNGLLRECSPSSFASDPVRVIRAIRYGLVFGLRIEEKTFSHLKQSVSDLNSVSGERKRDELFKILDSCKPGQGFEQLYQLGILRQMGFPEPASIEIIKEKVASAYQFLQRVIQLAEPGRGDAKLNGLPVKKETVAQLVSHLRERNSSDRSIYQLLILAGFLGRMEPGEVKAITTRLLLSREESDRLITLASNSALDRMIVEKNMPDDRKMYHYFRETHETGVDMALMAMSVVESEALSSAKTADSERIAELCGRIIAFWFEKPEVANPTLLLNGNDLMVNFDLTPGPLVGELIEKLREEQAAGMIKDRKSAMEWVEAQLATRLLHPPLE